MNKESREVIKGLKTATTEEECVAILDKTISLIDKESPYITDWHLSEFVKVCMKYANKNKKNASHYDVCRNYAVQFITFICDKYLELDKSERSVDMFSAIIKACFSFDNKCKHMYKRLFRDEGFLRDWLINDESELDTNFMISEVRSDKFLIMKNAIEIGNDDYKGRNISMYQTLNNVRDELNMFIGLTKRLDELVKASMFPLSKDEFKILVKAGFPELLYKTEHTFYAGKYHGAPDDMKPVEGWNYLLDSTNPKEVSWCIQFPMKDVVAKNELPLDRNVLAKIFRFKQCQSSLYNNPVYSYAIPDMIEFAKNRRNHNTLCVEFKDILGYLDEDIENLVDAG